MNDIEWWRIWQIISPKEGLVATLFVGLLITFAIHFLVVLGVNRFDATLLG